MTTSSQTLSQAVANLAGKRARLVQPGQVVSVLADGTLVVQVAGEQFSVRSVNDQNYEVGMWVHCSLTDRNDFVVMGIA